MSRLTAQGCAAVFVVSPALLVAAVEAQNRPRGFSGIPAARGGTGSFDLSGFDCGRRHPRILFGGTYPALQRGFQPRRDLSVYLPGRSSPSLHR